MDDSDAELSDDTKKHRNMFTGRAGRNYTMNNVFFNAGLGSDSDYDSEYESDDSDESEGRRMENNVLTN